MNLKEVLTSRRSEITLAVLIVAVLIGSGMYAYSQMNIENHQATYSANGSVIDNQGDNLSLGINAGKDLNFGRIVEGTNITKTIEVDAGNRTLALVEISSDGNISDNLVFDERKLFYNNTNIELELNGRNPGYYEGNVLLKIKTAENWWGEKWLELLYRSPF